MKRGGYCMHTWNKVYYLFRGNYCWTHKTEEEETAHHVVLHVWKPVQHLALNVETKW